VGRPAASRGSTSIWARQRIVRRQLIQVGWDVYNSDLMSEAGGRTVAMDAGTVAVLRAWRRAQLEERTAWGRRGRTPLVVSDRASSSNVSVDQRGRLITS
jgi:hypothetical protein